MPGEMDTAVVSAVKEATNLLDLFELERKVVLKISGKESIIGEIREVVLYGDSILIMDSYVAKRVFLFDNDGNYLRMIGAYGEGPGEYRQPVCLYARDRGEILIANNIPGNINIYASPDSFSRIVPQYHYGRILNFDRFVENPVGYYFYAPANGKHKIISVNKQFEMIGSFCPDEPELQKINHAGGDMAITEAGVVWVAGIFNPLISLYSPEGKLIRETGKHLLQRDYAMKPDLVKNLERHDFQAFIKVAKGRQAITLLMNIGDQLILAGHFHYDFAFHYDIYDINGNLLREQLPFDVEFQMICGASRNKIVAYSFESEEQMKDLGINAIIYIYGLKDHL